MGCGGSKLDDLQAVALCRTRSRLLADAIRAHDSLAAAHAAYSTSLRSVGAALRLFLHSHSLSASSSVAASSSPVLRLPSRRKSVPSPPPVSLHSGEHTTTFHVSYARTGPTPPAVSFVEQPEITADYSSHDYSNYTYPTYPSYSYAYPYGYAEYGGYYGVPPQPQANVGPPPSSPPRVSGWEFLNPFESYDNVHNNVYAAAGSSAAVDLPASYTPSRSSREVREEEGIPDLEDDDDEQCEIVVKEAVKTRSSYSRKSSSTDNDDDDNDGDDECCPQCDLGYEHIVEKNVVSRKIPATRQSRDFSEVIDQIESQFNKASDSADNLYPMLEVGKFLYSKKSRASSKGMMSLNTPTSGKDWLVFDENREMGGRSLSKTLQKIYMWEKKLHAEVRAEEKMRILLNKCCKQLQYLDRKGAEAQKIDATHATIQKLSTRIRIAIQFVDSITKKINKLRDEELWPQIRDLIQGFTRMWQNMLQCHRSQIQAISAAKKLFDCTSSMGTLSDAHLEAIRQLELEMLDWVTNFSNWVNAQRNYIRLLNGWLLKFIHNEPEVTPGGMAPFSPGRFGAPPIFVTCNYWSRAMAKISEGEVLDAMQSFAANILQLWQEHHIERRQKVLANTEMGSALRILDKEEQQMRRAVDAQSKKLALVSSQNGLSLNGYGSLVHRHTIEGGSLESSLRQIFTAMENYTANSMIIYQELCNGTEEERLSKGNTKVP